MSWTGKVVGNLGRGGAKQAFQIGQVATMQRVFTQSDVDAFCQLTGDGNPIHAKGEGVVPGLLCASLIPSIFASRCPGAIYVSQDFKFKGKVLVGDAATAEISVQRVKDLRGRVVVDCETKVFACSKEGQAHVEEAIQGSARVLVSQND